MIVENIETSNWSAAIRGMRNPMESWDKSNSTFTIGVPSLCTADYGLAMNLVRAGSSHRKFMRQIFISADVTMPWYWWKEYATYKVGTTENSTSQMHKLGSRLLMLQDFEHEGVDQCTMNMVALVNKRIEAWWKSGKKKPSLEWRQMIQCIPGSYRYRRTISLNYEVLRTMYDQRKDHRLEEWQHFLNHLLAAIPYREFIDEKVTR